MSWRHFTMLDQNLWAAKESAVLLAIMVFFGNGDDC
jgi:hypothetical protein